MTLLQSDKDSGYPTDYLISRIRARRQNLIHDWDTAMHSDLSDYIPSYSSLKSPDKAWTRLSHEYKWVYTQMNSSIRTVFSPYFEYFEMKTLMACLRLKKKKTTGPQIDFLLQYSLLSDRLKEILMAETELKAVIEKVKEYFPYVSSYTAEFDSSVNMLMNLEQKLIRTFLEQTVRANLNPVLNNFFSYLIDSLNITAIYKNLRWELETEPQLIRGGSLSLSKLSAAFRNRELSDLAQPVYNIARINIETSITSKIENALLSGITRKLRLIAREHSVTGIIIDYLWRHYIEALNLSIIACGKELSKDTLKEELVFS